ncbi:hypothetical protein HY640_05215 [Candidatus Woesearchaeota archaeon]|nr:hypothetical protein [Candidatus Woesearchaeota archaeon]
MEPEKTPEQAETNPDGIVDGGREAEASSPNDFQKVSQKPRHRPSHAHVNESSHVHDSHEASHHRKSEPEGIIRTMTIAVMLAFLVLLLFTQFQIYNIQATLDMKVAEADEAAKPAEIRLSLLTDAGCPNCAQLTSVVSGIKGFNVNVTGEESIDYSTAQGRKLAGDYEIKSLPALIVTGQIDRLPGEGFTRRRDALVFEQTAPPYVDLNENRVVGKVALTVVNDTSCSLCSSAADIGTSLRLAGMDISAERVVDVKSSEGMALVEKYNLTRVPTVLLSKEAGRYSFVMQVWPQLGTVEPDAYVLRKPNPPFVDLQDGKLKGLASVTLLNDTSCSKCYDVTQHMTILERGFGVRVGEVKVVDVSGQEGKALVQKYSLKAAPTILVRNVDIYDALQQPWTTVGSVEQDGTYIFRNFANWPGHPYMDLSTGQLMMNAEQQ